MAQGNIKAWYNKNLDSIASFLVMACLFGIPACLITYGIAEQDPLSRYVFFLLGLFALIAPIWIIVTARKSRGENDRQGS